MYFKSSCFNLISVKIFYGNPVNSKDGNFLKFNTVPDYRIVNYPDSRVEVSMVNN